jgi:hypothetical protein
MFIAATPISSPEIGMPISGFFVLIAGEALVRTLYPIRGSSRSRNQHDNAPLCAPGF